MDYREVTKVASIWVVLVWYKSSLVGEGRRDKQYIYIYIERERESLSYT